MSKLDDLLRKLKALADQGVGGEKTNAQHMLQKLMARHGISSEALEEAQVKKHRIEVSEKYQVGVLSQCILKVMGKNYPIYEVGSSDGKQYTSWECTLAQFIEVKAYYDFYYPLWEQEVKAFYFAFVQKHQILPFNASQMSSSEMDPAEVKKMMDMQRGMDDKNFQKQIE